MWQKIHNFLGSHKRKLGAGLVMALVIVAPYSVVLVSQHYKHTNLHAAADCTPSAILVNPCRPWLGAWAKDYPQASTGVKNQVTYHEQRIGKQIDLIKDYKTEGGTLSADDKYYVNRANTYLLLTWKPAGSFGTGASSSAYSSIDAMANSVKSVAPKKIFLSIWHEPENDVSPGTTSCSNAQGNAGSPAQYVSMWQNVHNRFAADGVNNVVWTFIPMGYSGWNCMEKSLWPGNNLVDWVMWDPYANGDNDSWDKTISPFYNWMTANNDASHAYLSKPWGIAETGIHLNSQESSGVAFWQEAKQALDANTFPLLKAYVVFDSSNGKPDNRVGYWCKAWSGSTCNSGQLVSDPNKQAAYKAFANDPIFSSVTTTGDTNPPTVSITAPANGATISGTTAVSANATDDVQVAKVVFSIDGTVVSTDTGQPYSLNLDTTGYTNGSHTITATAYDTSNNHKAQSITITIDNSTPPPPPPGPDTTPPVASITSPANGATISKTITFSADATDNVKVAKVVFTVDGNAVATDMTPPYSTSLDTTLYTNGSHTLRAKAYDAAGNTRTPQITVTVSNAGTPPNPTILSFTANPAGTQVGGGTLLKWTAANAINCSVNPDGPQKTTVTSWMTLPYTAPGTKTYTLTCYNSIGKTASATVAVTINPAPQPPAKPTVSADKTAVAPGDSVLISWSSAGAASCTLNPGNIINQGTTGSKLIGNLQQTTTFTVTCMNGAGVSSNTLQVTVSPRPVDPGPIIDSFIIQPNSVSAGSTATLTWSTSNVATNGCALVPSPLTSAAANGSWQTASLSASASYTLTCKGYSGLTVDRSVSVTVNGTPAPTPPASVASSDSPVSSPTVKALGGQTVVNAQSQDTVDKGQLVTLDPSNVLDEKKALSILRVEYYNGEKLIQTVNDPPYALDTKSLPAGVYTLTERTYYEDGSMSARTQDITVKDTAALTAKKGSTRTGLVVLLALIIFAGAVAVYIFRRVQLSRSMPAAMISGLNPDEIIVSPQLQQPPQPPAVSPDDPNNWPPTGMPPAQ